MIIIHVKIGDILNFSNNKVTSVSKFFETSEVELH